MLSPAPVTFKANPPRGPLPTLPAHGLLAVEGPDAAAFLQAQLMNDVRTLEPSQWQWSGWLTAKGRLVALFALLRTAPDRFVLVLPDFPAAELQARLQRYVFRSKLRMDVPAGWRCAADLAPGPEDPGRAHIAEGDDATGWRLDMGGHSGPRALWLLPPDSPFAAEHDATVDARWLALDLAQGLPRLPPAGSEAWTPQMLSLERLRAFSLSKGCYPGQEIVARTHYLGKAKRQLARLAGASLRAGETVADASGAIIGQLACANADGSEGLAVLALDPPGPAEAQLLVEGRPVRVLPLAAGLARPL